MLVDPGDALSRHWDREILDKQDAQSMWNFFTDSLVSLLDADSIGHLVRDQSYLVRMYFYFALMSVVPVSMGKSKRYIVAANNEEYLLKNIHCIQKFNKSLTYEHIGNVIYIDPLPINFKIDSFSDRQTYQIPEILGGSRYAYTLFAEDL